MTVNQKLEIRSHLPDCVMRAGKSRISSLTAIKQIFYTFESFNKNRIMELAEEKNQENLTEGEEKKWYVVYTRARAEKKTFSELHDLGVEAYVPLQKKMHQWADRKKIVEEPLIRSYVFVKLLPRERDQVFMCPHVIKYISFEGKPAEVPQKQILQLQQFISAAVPLEATMDLFRPGEKVKIIYGPLSGITGELVSTGSSQKFMLRIDKIGYSLLATIPAAWVEKI